MRSGYEITLPIVSSVALDFEGVRRGRNVNVPEASQTWGSLRACSPRNFVKFRFSEMRSPAFSAGHFQSIKTKENAVISCLFHPISSVIIKVQCLRQKRVKQ